MLLVPSLSWAILALPSGPLATPPPPTMAPSRGGRPVTRPIGSADAKPAAGGATRTTARRAGSKLGKTRVPTVLGLVVLSLVIQLLLYHTSTRLKRVGLSPDATGRAVGVFKRDGPYAPYLIGGHKHEHPPDEETDSGTLLGIDYTAIYCDAPVGSRPFVFVGFALWWVHRGRHAQAFC